VYTALPAILPATNIFFSVFKIAYRDVLQNGHQDLRSDIDVTELAEKQAPEALAKQGLDSIDSSNLLLEECFESGTNKWDRESESAEAHHYC
jgi:hypothetical protein